MADTITTTPTNINELIRSVSIHVSGSNVFTRFRRLYAHDRIAFVYDILPSFAKTMAPYQEEIFGLLDDGNNRVAVRGPHGLGKTAMASILTHHGVLTAESDCKVATTASAWRQLDKYLWPEIKKTARFLNWVEIGRPQYTRDELLTMSIKLSQGLIEAFAVASDDHTTIEGAHASRMVYIFDEAKTIPRDTWDAAEGAFSSEGLEVSEYEKGISSNKEFAADNQSSSSQYGSIGTVDNRSPSDIIEQLAKKNIDSVSEDISGASGVSRVSLTPEEISQFTAALTRSRPQSSVRSHHKDILSKVTRDEIVEDNRQKTSIVSTGETYEAIAFAISTPGAPSGQFYDIHMHRPGYEDWITRHVTLDEAIRAGRISPKWALQRAVQWGTDSSVYMNRVLGEFADNSEDGIIPLSWIRAANERWLEYRANDFTDVHGKQVLGVDVARSGEDKTVFSWRVGGTVRKLHIYSRLLTTQTAGHVKALARDKVVQIEMDGGLGAAVYDMLKEDSVKNLRPITVSASTAWRDRSRELSFINVRAAMWWNMRELLDPTYDSEVALPPLEELTLDLSTPRWTMKKDATVQLESKVEIEKRIGRSTDYGDAVCLSFWQASRGGGVVF